MKLVHQAYVISDLHLGGAFPSETDRGFRMMREPEVLADFIRALAAKGRDPSVELVINGDFIDFLAEATDDGHWKSFREQPGEAVAVFERFADRARDAAVLDQLGAFLDAGHRLTILLGNHDIELAWPEVRSAFERRLRASPLRKTGAFDLRWLHDGEALVIADALIEHGNRYDPANFVDHDRFRQVRELRSRRLHHLEHSVFHPPVGSRLVAEVMNPVKREYPFIDLLKPESEPLFALILALDPSKRKLLGKLAAVLKDLPISFAQPAAHPGFRQPIAATSGSAADGVAGPAPESALADVIAEVVPPEEADRARAETAVLAPPAVGISREPIASAFDRVRATWGLIRLLGVDDDGELERRLPLVQHALRALNGDQTFDQKVEPGKRYLRAAQELASQGDFRFVLFGHTHHRKRVPLKGGATYVNTGTWARLMSFPDELLGTDRDAAANALRCFMQSIQDGTFKTVLEPSYARIDVGDDGRVQDVYLKLYDRNTQL